MGIRRYECPATVESAVELLTSESGPATVLAGGTDLIADVRAGRSVGLLVDIKKIPELSELRWAADGTLTIGACVFVQRLAEDARIRERYPGLATAAGSLGSYQVRCRATVAGNLGNASPCADTAPALLVLNALVQIASSTDKGEAASGAGSIARRTVPLDGFIRDVKKTALQRGEVITAVIVPPQPDGLRTAFLKIKRTRGHDMALVNAAGAYDPVSREWRLAIGSAACTPVLIRGLEGVCPPGATAEQVGEQLAERALAGIQPIDDVRASAEYRRDMTALLCRRLAHALLEV